MNSLMTSSSIFYVTVFWASYRFGMMYGMAATRGGRSFTRVPSGRMSRSPFLFVETSIQDRCEESNRRNRSFRNPSREWDILSAAMENRLQESSLEARRCAGRGEPHPYPASPRGWCIFPGESYRASPPGTKPLQDSGSRRDSAAADVPGGIHCIRLRSMRRWYRNIPMPAPQMST